MKDNVKWHIDWKRTTSDEEGYTVLNVVFLDKSTRQKEVHDVSLKRFADFADFTVQMGEYASEMNCK
jgi:hypothetical protein